MLRQDVKEGDDVPKALTEWIMSMEDYFTLAKYNPLAQGIMGRAKLKGLAKLWWKLHCQTQGRAKATMGWEDLMSGLKELLHIFGPVAVLPLNPKVMMGVVVYCFPLAVQTACN